MKKLSMFTVLAFSLLVLLIFTAASGETPQKTYSKYNKAAINGSFQQMKVFICNHKIQEYENQSAEQQRKMLQYIQIMAPREYLVIESNISGNKAVLKLRGKIHSKQDKTLKDAIGEVHMIREEGTWRIMKENWRQ